MVHLSVSHTRTLEQHRDMDSQLLSEPTGTADTFSSICNQVYAYECMGMFDSIEVIY